MDKSTLVRVREEWPPSWYAKVVQNSKCLNYYHFSKIRDIKPKMDKLTNSIQLYPSLESKELWLLFLKRGFVVMWPLSENQVNPGCSTFSLYSIVKLSWFVYLWNLATRIIDCFKQWHLIFLCVFRLPRQNSCFMVWNCACHLRYLLC